ncbi:hypothetical protein ABZW49_10430 [Nonomuraea wenchangensis]
MSERSSEVVEFITARLNEGADKAMKGLNLDQVKVIEALRSLLRDHVGYYGAGDDEHFPIPTLTTIAAIWDDRDDYPDVLKP